MAKITRRRFIEDAFKTVALTASTSALALAETWDQPVDPDTVIYDPKKAEALLINKVKENIFNKKDVMNKAIGFLEGIDFHIDGLPIRNAIIAANIFTLGNGKSVASFLFRKLGVEDQIKNAVAEFGGKPFTVRELVQHWQDRMDRRVHQLIDQKFDNYLKLSPADYQKTLAGKDGDIIRLAQGTFGQSIARQFGREKTKPDGSVEIVDNWYTLPDYQRPHFKQQYVAQQFGISPQLFVPTHRDFAQVQLPCTSPPKPATPVATAPAQTATQMRPAG